MTAVTLVLAAMCSLSSSASSLLQAMAVHHSTDGLLNLVLFYTLTSDVRMQLVLGYHWARGGPGAGQFHFVGCLGDFDPMDS
jgi:hypothetical protein